MQFPIFVTAIFAAAVAASPLDLPIPPKQATYSSVPTPTGPSYPYPTGDYDGCPNGLFSIAQCCATDILGVADLDCHSPPAIPRSAPEFRYICAAGGQRARCCVLPVAGQALLCQGPVGV
ncbi:hypothetical protein NUW58_g807 [Xylaria curta]|uniref:Uncharacterized protein n=1 Tax=Xylaria curta TaxID=42375 RepID=A0ACC1PNT9_9PEZI|nr:hypothetical protein NUW58_g807 [Xylaria curta]